MDGETEYVEQMKKDVNTYKKFIDTFRKESGPSLGSGNQRGGFDWANFRTSITVSTGAQSGTRKVMRTKKEFISIMEGRGMSKDWAEAEFNRRLIDPRRDTGVDADTGLQTVEISENYVDEFTNRQRSDTMLAGTKTKKRPKQKDFEELLTNLGEDYARSSVTKALAGGDILAAFASEMGTASTGFSAKEYLNKILEADASDASVASTVGESTCSGAGGEVPGQGGASSKKAKFFDAAEEALKVKAKASRELGSIIEKVDDTTNALHEALAEEDELVKVDKHLFAERYHIMRSRAHLLKDATESLNQEEFARALTDLTSNCMKDGVPSPMPQVVLAKLICVKVLGCRLGLVASILSCFGQSQNETKREKLVSNFIVAFFSQICLIPEPVLGTDSRKYRIALS